MAEILEFPSHYLDSEGDSITCHFCESELFYPFSETEMECAKCGDLWEFESIDDS